MYNREELVASIKNKDKERVLKLLEYALKNLTEETTVDFVLPASITELHSLLVSEMNANPRLMQIRVRVPNRTRRAFLFIQGMINAVRRCA